MNDVSVSAQYRSMWRSTASPHTQHLSLIWGKNWITLDEKSPSLLPPAMKLRIPPFTCVEWCRVTHGDQICLAFTPDSCLQAEVIVESNILAWMCGYLPYQNCVNLWSQKVCCSYEWHVTAALDLSGDVCPKVQQLSLNHLQQKTMSKHQLCSGDRCVPDRQSIGGMTITPTRRRIALLIIYL